MNRKIHVISDTHFGHFNIIKYANRPFDNIHSMDECIADSWNSVVRDQDIVYHLGDVYFGRNCPILWKLKGRKRLILGNHDDGKDQLLHDIFEKIMLWRPFPEYGCILSHMPLLNRSLRNNDDNISVHGHIHEKDPPSNRHINVSVERINYTPVELEELVHKHNK